MKPIFQMARLSLAFVESAPLYLFLCFPLYFLLTLLPNHHQFGAENVDTI